MATMTLEEVQALAEQALKKAGDALVTAEAATAKSSNCEQLALNAFYMAQDADGKVTQLQTDLDSAIERAENAGKRGEDAAKEAEDAVDEINEKIGALPAGYTVVSYVDEKAGSGGGGLPEEEINALLDPIKNDINGIKDDISDIELDTNNIKNAPTYKLLWTAAELQEVLCGIIGKEPFVLTDDVKSAIVQDVLANMPYYNGAVTISGGES